MWVWAFSSVECMLNKVETLFQSPVAKIIIIIIHKYEAFDATLVIHRVLTCICRNYYFLK